MLGIKVSVIICTCNRAEHLRQTLAAMADVCVPDTMPTELIVVDNASTDETAEVVQQCQLPNMLVRYVHEPRRGQCYARNTGMAEAHGDVFLFTDDDVRPPENWIEGMCGPILRGEVDAIVGGVEIAPHLNKPWMTSYHRTWLASTEGINPEAPQNMVGANMAFSRKVLKKVPAFDTELGPGQLGFGDDTLFSWQIRQAGFRLISALHVTIEHHFDPSRLERHQLRRIAENAGRSAAYLSYHWCHNKTPFARRALIKHFTRLKFLRIMRRSECLSSEGIAPWELHLLFDISLYKQHLVEEKKEKKYQEQGLVKLCG